MKAVRAVLLALLLSLLFGLAVGTLIRLRLERPVYYLGGAMPTGTSPPVAYASARSAPQLR